MAYVGIDSGVVGYSGLTVLPDWTGTKVYFLQTSALLGDGIRQFDIDPNGDETLKRTAADIGVSGINTGSGGAASLSYNGETLVFISETGNSCRMALVQASDLTLLTQFGTAGSSAGASTASRLLSPHMIAPYDGEFVLACAGALGEFDALPEPALTPNVNAGNADEKKAFGLLLGRGGAGETFAIALPFSNGTLGGGTNDDPIGVYSITSGGVGKIGTFSPADIDATWTNIVTARGCAYDVSDGNIIIAVQTSDAVSTTKYLAKLDTGDASVVWVRAVNAITPYSWSLTHSRVNGTYHYLGSSATVYHIDTTDGSATTETFTGIAVTGVQVSDSTTNSIILYGNFAPGGSPPDYLGTYMTTGGHTTLTSQWMRIWFATMGGGENPQDSQQGGLALSDQRAWYFTLDGHDFYVLDLKAEGTWVYDQTTGEWAQFVTSGSGRWDALNGTMWKTRVVAGSLETEDVREISATALDDNDSDVDIAHLATGGLQTRSRDKVPVDAVRLTGSVGDLGNTSGSTMRLRFSDDNGRTWSAYFDVTLSQADYSGEIAWRSLGSFAAPGRVFEFSDNGGPRRIDGVDVESSLEGA